MVTNNPGVDLFTKLYEFPTKLVENLLPQQQAPVQEEKSKSKGSQKAAIVSDEDLESNEMPRQAPPTLSQTFTAKWNLTVVSIQVPPYSNYTLSGSLAFDFTKSGFFLMYNQTTGLIPYSLEAGLIFSPDRNGVELLGVSPEDECYSYIYFQWLWTYLVPPFQIPYDSFYLGTQKIRGDLCTVWQLPSYNIWAFSAYVRVSDNMVVRAIVPDPYFNGQQSVLDLYDVSHNVDPSLFNRPAVCAELMNWNPSWQSHLPWAWCFPYCV